MKRFTIFIFMCFLLVCACDNTTIGTKTKSINTDLINTNDRQVEQLVLKLKDLNSQIPQTRGRFWDRLFSFFYAEHVATHGEEIEATIGNAL